jgi:tetratricopeptide (TPR) repeat protein
MKLLHTILPACAIALFMAAPTVNAQKGIDNPVTKAVLDVYEKQLKEDPTDYETWLHRANEYYAHSEYMRALNDVDNAIKYVPASEKETREQAYMLRANIYQQTGRLDDALQDLNTVVESSPESYVAIYQRANVEYELEKYTDAKNDFRRLQRFTTRSAESYIGLARIAVKENNLGLANEYLDQAVQIDPNNADYYVRRASVRQSMGNDQGAVEDLIVALSIDSKSTRATQGLVNYGNTNYPAVIAGLTSAMASAPRVGMYVYLRAVIAQAHYRYPAAVEDFQKINDEQLYNYHGIYASLAECQFALGQYQKALDNIEQAISMDSNVASHHALKSKILRAMGRSDVALNSALTSTVVNPGLVDPLLEMALCKINLEKYDEASDLIGEAIINDAENPYALILRAWLLQNYLNQPQAAKQYYKNAAEIEKYDATDVNSLRGFALLLSGDNQGATQWMENILNNVDDKDGYISYMGACFFSMAGDSDRAIELVEKSLSAGYANYHNWNLYSDGPINVSAIRDDLRFLQSLNRHNVIFCK